MTYKPPCVGAPAYLFYPDDLEDELDFPAPEMCNPASCARTLDCLKDGWDEDFGAWGGFSLAERMTARMNKMTEEELWSTKFQSST